MAKEETPEDVIDAAPEPAWKKILPVVALLVALAGGAAAGAGLLGPSLGASMAESALAGPSKGGGHGGGHGKEPVSTIHLVDNLVLNPAGSGGARFLLTSIALEGGSEEGKAALAARDLEIRDAFILVLGSRTVEELSDVENRTRIIGELKTALDRLLGPGHVHRVLIPQFVIQ